MILALTVRGYEDMMSLQEKYVAVWEKKKKLNKNSSGSSKSLSYSAISDKADLSVSAKFTVFPFPFRVLFSYLQNYCHRCQLSVCFGDAPTASKSVSEKNGKSITKKDKA